MILTPEIEFHKELNRLQKELRSAQTRTRTYKKLLEQSDRRYEGAVKDENKIHDEIRRLQISEQN